MVECNKSNWKVLSKFTNYCEIHKQPFSDSNCPYEIKVVEHSFVLKGHPLNEMENLNSNKSDVSLNKEIEQGVAITNKQNPSLLYDSKLSTDVLTASKVSHAFRFVVNINSSVDWKNRRIICESKGLNVQLKGGFGNVLMTSYKGFKIWLADKSITIYFPNWKKYYVEQARFGFNYALEDLKVFLNSFSELLGINLSWDGIYRFKTSGQHHALIYNSLAKMYNRNNEKLNVYDKNGELWLVIDNSRRESIRMDDIETIGKTSDKNMDDVVDPFFNQLKETGLMPIDILNMFKVTNEQINVLVKDREYYADNLKSHVEAIKDLSSGIIELRTEIKKDKIKRFIDEYR